MPDRLKTLMAGGHCLGDTRRATQRCLDDRLVVARSTFGGPVSFASGIWEDVDWSGFDVVGIDAYRDEQNAPTTASCWPETTGTARWSPCWTVGAAAADIRTWDENQNWSSMRWRCGAAGRSRQSGDLAAPLPLSGTGITV
jgi:hypothetical protein